VLGSIFIASATICMVIFVSWGGQKDGYPWDSAVIICLIIAAIVLLALFIWQENRHPLPILNLQLFKERNFSLIMIMMFLMGLVMLGAFAFLPVYFQTVKGDSATASGFKLLPLVGGLMVFAGVSSAIMTKTGKFTGLLPAGALFSIIGVGILIDLEPGTGYGMVGGALFLIGCGFGFLFPVTTTIVQNSVPVADMANALSSLTFFQTVGGALGVAIVGAVLNEKTLERVMITFDPNDALTYGLAFTFVISTGIAMVVLGLSFFVRNVPLFHKEIAMG